jgi:hypothetical protein
VIEAQVRERELMLRKEMEEWMRTTRETLHGEYEARYQEALRHAPVAEGPTAGSASAQQPDLV